MYPPEFYEGFGFEERGEVVDVDYEGIEGYDFSAVGVRFAGAEEGWGRGVYGVCCGVGFWGEGGLGVWREPFLESAGPKGLQ